MTTGRSRREFMGLFVSAAAMAATRNVAAAVPGAAIPGATEHHRAIVIGSGFGGAIAAFRLGSAGVKTVVLERGRRWPILHRGDTFPTFFKPDRRSSWLTATPTYPGQPPTIYRPYVGLVEKVVGTGMSVICGAGVGGSSLIYAGVMIRPSEKWFTQVMPKGIDYAELEREYYPRAERRIGVARVPDDILAHERYGSSRLFLRQAQRAGLPGERVPVAVDWNVVRAELAGRAVAAASIGEYLTGVNSGARNSLDRNYLAQAEATGNVAVRPLHVVSDIGIDGRGKYFVNVDRIDEDGNVVEYKVLTADALFLGAGSTGTSQLLVRARDTGLLPKLDDQVGHHWGNNGDRIYLRTFVPHPTGARQGGPMCVAITDWDNPRGPVTIEQGSAPFPFETHAMNTPGFGICSARGHFEFCPQTGRVRLIWPFDGDLAAQNAIRRTLQRLVAATSGPLIGLGNVVSGVLGGVVDTTNGVLGGVVGAETPILGPVTGTASGLLDVIAAAPAGLIDVNGLDPVTFHPLGGAVIGKVCDDRGRVNEYPGLYVTDGALIPGSTAAVNPALTIAAIAERCMDDIVARDVGRLF